MSTREFNQSPIFKKIVEGVELNLHVKFSSLVSDPETASHSSTKNLELWDLKFRVLDSKVKFEVSVYWMPKLGVEKTFVPGFFSIEGEKYKGFSFVRYLKHVLKDESKNQLFQAQLAGRISTDEYIKGIFDLYAKYYDPYLKDILEGRSWPQDKIPDIRDRY